MGIIRGGVLGGFRNKTGSVVGASWRNLDVIRGLPKISSKPATQPQIDQRLKFGLVTSFLSLISEAIDVGYNIGSGSTSAMNEAVSYHLKEAVTGTSPDFTLDYTKIRFSSGKLNVPSSYSVAATTPAKIDLSWNLDGTDSKYKDATDTINVLVYNPSRGQFVTLMAAAPRSAQTYVLQLPPPFSGDEVHCYFSFTSVKKKALHSNSVYMQSITVL